MRTLRFERTWGSDAGRLPAGFGAVVLTSDPDVAYVLGQVEGRGALRAIEVSTGEIRDEFTLPPLVCVDRRVVVSQPGDDGVVLVGVVEGEGAVVTWLRLADGVTKPLARIGWPMTRVARLDAEPWALVDGEPLDAKGGAVWRPAEARWFTADHRWCVREEPGVQDAKGVLPVRLWWTEVATGVARELGVSTGRGVDAVFSDDGRRMWRMVDPRSSGGHEQERWHLDERRCVRETGYVHRPARYLATRDDADEALRVDGSNHLSPRVLEGARWSPRDAGVSPDGRRAARVQWGVLRVTDLERAADVTPCDAHATAVLATAFAPWSPLAASADTGGDIAVWSLDAGDVVWRFEAGDGVDQLVFSPDARFLYAVASAMRDGRPATALRVWDLSTGGEVTPGPMEFAGFGRVTLSPDGASALLSIPSGRFDGPQWLDLASWRATPLAVPSTPGAPTPRVASCVGGFSRDAETAWVHLRALGASSWERLTLDGRTGAPRAREAFRGTAAERATVIAGAERAAVSWAVEGGCQVHVFRHDDPTRQALWGLDLSPDHELSVGPTMCLIGTPRGEVRAVDDGGRVIAAATVPEAKRVTSVALSPDERRALVGTIQGRVHLLALDD